jgi:hypothetical protein
LTLENRQQMVDDHGRWCDFSSDVDDLMEALQRLRSTLAPALMRALLDVDLSPAQLNGLPAISWRGRGQRVSRRSVQVVFASAGFPAPGEGFTRRPRFPS